MLCLVSIRKYFHSEIVNYRFISCTAKSSTLYYAAFASVFVNKQRWAFVTAFVEPFAAALYKLFFWETALLNLYS